MNPKPWWKRAWEWLRAQPIGRGAMLQESLRVRHGVQPEDSGLSKKARR
jgi:hypothetical protein